VKIKGTEINLTAKIRAAKI